MKSKKGFSLIELLAVIAILALIALISVPIVSIIINDSKKSSFETSVKNIMDAIDWYILDEYDGVVIGERQFDLSENGIREVINGSYGKSIKYDGSVKGNGEVIINSQGNYYVVYYDGTYCAQKDFLIKKITITNGECN